MSVEHTRKVMEKYWESVGTDVTLFAEDVVYTLMATGEEARTPHGVLQMLTYFYHVAFDAVAETKTTIIGDGHALWEGYLVGRHTGEYVGIPVTGKSVRVPLTVIYDIEDDRIKGARIYLEVPVLLEQLGVNQQTSQAGK